MIVKKIYISGNQSQSKRTVASLQPGASGPQKSPARPPNDSTEPKKVSVRTQKGPVRPQTETIGPKKGPVNTQNEPVGPQKGPVAPPKRNSRLLANSPTVQPPALNQEKINGDSSSISPPTRKTFKKIKKQPPSASASGDGKVNSSS